MQSYIAQTLLYDKTIVDDVDAETGAPIQRERGYIEPGQPIDLDDARAEILLAVGAIARPPAAEEATPDAPAVELTRRRRA